jgi:hypothetical protein
VFDLDTGAVGGAGDVWFEAVTASQLFLTPRGGAQRAVGDRSNRGRDGCAAASFSTSRVPLSAVPVGTGAMPSIGIPLSVYSGRMAMRLIPRLSDRLADA